jgi:hypothetical protein
LLSRFEPKTPAKITENGAKETPYFDGMSSGKLAHEQKLFAENLKKSREIKEQLKDQHKGPRPR